MHDFDFLLAACKMNETEKVALVSVFNKKSPDGNTNSDTAEKPSNTKDDVKNDKKSGAKARLGMLSNQKTKKAHFKTSRKRKSSIFKKMVGNNIIDIKSLKVSKVTCGKCYKTFKSRTKLFKHKAMKHLSLSVKSKKGKMRKKVSPLKKASYIAATTANRAVEALLVGNSSGSQEQKTTTENDGGCSAVNEVPLLESNKEIKDEMAKDSGHITKTGPSEAIKPEMLTPNNKTEGDSEAREALKTIEKSCRDCVELADSASKLSRHQRYVHGLKIDNKTGRDRRDYQQGTPVRSAGSYSKPDTPVRTAGSDSKQDTPVRSVRSDSKQDIPVRSAGSDSKQDTPVRSAGSDSKQDTPVRSAGEMDLMAASPY